MINVNESDKIIYAILKCDNGKLVLKEFPVSLNFEPSDSQLREYFNFAVSLSDAYSSDLDYLHPDKEDQFRCTRNWRRLALAFQYTSDKIRSKNNVVAISHRQGGWKTIIWKYNNDISFEIYSNFGFGSCSELISRFFYKGIQLTPYSDYVRYRFAKYSEMIHYTYKYHLEYSQWNKLMNDTLLFYNAVCENQENEIFSWLRTHLSEMTNGLNDILSSSCYYFERPDGTYDGVSGDDLEEVRAVKISGAVQFVKNIKTLPCQVNPESYLHRLNNLFSNYLLHARKKVSELDGITITTENRLNYISELSVISIYDRLRKWHYYKDYWHLGGYYKIKMFKYLLTLNRRLPTPISKNDIRANINDILELVSERDALRAILHQKTNLLNTIQKAADFIAKYGK